jgi:hypothetical protein
MLLVRNLSVSESPFNLFSLASGVMFANTTDEPQDTYN